MLDLHPNELLTEHFSARLDEIEDYLKGRLPNRGHIIEAAFTAHRNEHHLLSVPVILAQVDGVCKELAGQYFFSRRAGKPQTAAYVAQFTPGTFRSAMLSAFAELLPVTASESERGPNFDNLNRHMILHGESLDYGSRINGLKAISLLNYVASMLQPDEETGEVTVPDSTGLSTEDDLA